MQYQQAKKALIHDFNDFSICELTPTVIAHSVTLLENNTLNAMNTLHIACAMKIKPDIFISADIQQIKTVKKSHFKTLQI